MQRQRFWLIGLLGLVLLAGFGVWWLWQREINSLPNPASNPSATLSSSPAGTPTPSSSSSLLPLPTIVPDASPSLPANLTTSVPLPVNATIEATSVGSDTATGQKRTTVVATIALTPQELLEEARQLLKMAGFTLGEEKESADEFSLTASRPELSLALHINRTPVENRTWFDLVILETGM